MRNTVDVGQSTDNPMKNQPKRSRVLLIGLDCAAPELLFEKWINDLPHLRSLLQRGVHGPLRSCDPPITVPAWSVMMSSRSPGSLGIYGFRNRMNRSYDQYSIANSESIQVDRLWDLLSKAGKKVVLLGVPQTYPPSPVNGIMVTDFLTPNTKVDYTYPPEFRKEVESVVGEYLFDVREFRNENKKKILAEIYEMTEKRFKLARHLLPRSDWDFFMMVEMGIDRIHHAFWGAMDREHRRYIPGNPDEKVIFEYYQYIDREIGRLLELIDEETTVLVVSDHGAIRMEGGICINDWLVSKGALSILEKPLGITPFSKVKIDWSKTEAWGEGGYYARIFINVKGREPQGIVDPADYEKVRDRLIRELSAIPDEKGNPLGTRVFRPEELYREVRGVAPDLIVYWGDLKWRSVGSIGNSALHVFENDTGPDDANHAPYGIFMMDPARNRSDWKRGSGKIEGLEIVDIAPLILELLGEEIPKEMEGRPWNKI